MPNLNYSYKNSNYQDSLIPLLEELANVIPFTQEELAFNQQGLLAPSQKRRLLGTLYLKLLVTLFVLAIFVVLGFLAFREEALYLTLDNQVTMLVVFGSVPSIITVIFLVKASTILRELLTGRVAIAVGHGKRTPDRAARPRFNIADQHLKISPIRLFYIKDGVEYKAYYTPRTKKLLTLEPVTNAVMVKDDFSVFAHRRERGTFRSLIVLPILLLICAGLILPWRWQIYNQYKAEIDQLNIQPNLAIAQIISKDIERTGKNHNVIEYQITYLFIAENKSYQRVANVSQAKFDKSEVGQSLQIQYLASNPEVNRLADMHYDTVDLEQNQSFFWTSVFACVFTVLLFIATVFSSILLKLRLL